jgi:hypothetical protein
MVDEGAPGARVCVALEDVDEGKRERASPRREFDSWNSFRQVRWYG